MGRTIKAIKLLYPELMGQDAAEKILKLHQLVGTKEEEKAELYTKQCLLEKEIDAIKNELLDLSDVYEIVYEDEQPRELQKGEAPAVFESNGTIHI